MTKIDFYFNASNTFSVIAKLVTKATLANAYVLVYTRNEKTQSEFSRYLWTASSLAFIPHVSCNHLLARKTPVLIGGDINSLSKLDILINLEQEVPDIFTQFSRLLEVVGYDAEEIFHSRKKFRYYKDNGYVIANHDLKGGHD